MALLLGPTPVPVAITRAEALLEQARDHPRVQAYTFGALCLLNARCGNFDEARRLGATARGICEELEWRFLLGAGVPQVDGGVELLAGEPVAAERAMRPGYELLVEMGEKSHFSTVAAMLAEALYRQGLDEEADRFTAVSEEAAASEDVAAQIAWRSTRAKVVARRGLFDEAKSLGRQAVVLAEEIDAPDVKADALMDLAEVLSLADQMAEAAAMVGQAISLYEAKGNQVSARRARSFRDQLSAARR